MSEHALAARLRAAIGSVGGHMDVWAVFEDAELFGAVVDALADAVEPLGATRVVSVESRGFLLGGAVAAQLGLGFVAVRKPGSLFPGEKVSTVTAPDYRGATTELRMLARSTTSGDQVVMVDDWVELGAQALAVRELVERTGATWLGVVTMVDQTTDAVGDAVPILAALVDAATLEGA